MTVSADMLLALAGFLIAGVGNIITIIRVWGKMEARMDVIEANAQAERAFLHGKINDLLAEIARLRDQKHDHTGTVQRHDGAIRDLDRRVTRLEHRCDDHLIGKTEDE